LLLVNDLDEEIELEQNLKALQGVVPYDIDGIISSRSRQDQNPEEEEPPVVAV
jgi:hypothetical protein